MQFFVDCVSSFGFVCTMCCLKVLTVLKAVFILYFLAIRLIFSESLGTYGMLIKAAGFSTVSTGSTGFNVFLFLIRLFINFCG